MTNDIIHHRDQQRFEAIIDGKIAELTYHQTDNRMVITHTGVPPELGGKGLGGALAKKALDYAAEHHLQVVPSCPFVAAYIAKHPEYRSLL